MHTTEPHILKAVLVTAITFSVGANLNAQSNKPRAEDLLTTIDQQITAGSFISAQRTSVELLSEIFAEIKAQPPTNFEPTHAGGVIATSVPQLLVQTEAIRQAVRKPDLVLARDLSMPFARSIQNVKTLSDPQPAETLQKVELQSTGKAGFDRFLLLPKLAKAAFKTGNFTAADGYASEALALASTNKDRWPVGEAVHQGNIVKGRILLLQGNVSGATAYLLAAGKTKGSPALNSFGPTMALAEDLLNHGQSQAVVQYLSECRSFWSDHIKNDEWIRLINSGKRPDFGANLKY
jgi:hypothetical protein